jgi:hypothetical protein
VNACRDQTPGNKWREIPASALFGVVSETRGLRKLDGGGGVCSAARQILVHDRRKLARSGAAARRSNCRSPKRPFAHPAENFGHLR